MSEGVKPAWYNSFDYSQIVKLIQMTIVNMFKNSSTTNLWGFKEIRYDSGDIQYITEFKELFPQTRVIIQIRENIRQQSKSGWFDKDKTATAFLKKTNRELVEFANNNKNWCFLTSFEQMFHKPNMENLFTFIGCRENYNEMEIDAVLKNNIKD